jgi:septal ring factor EnvC (AmiA/AmiB activator)
VFNGWTPEFGYIISIQHQNNWLSTYKQNSAIYKEVGTFVKAGETISVVGESNDQYKRKGLKFELWHNGMAVNPLNYISF